MIRGLEARRIDCMVRKDLQGLSPLLADDLSYSHSSGRTDTKASFLELVRKGHYLGVDFATSAVIVSGDAAVVRGLARMHVTGEDGAELRYPVLFLDVYVRRNGHWQLLAWQATRARE
jgi:hypothetical protein